MEISFISSKTYKERNRKRENSTLFMFGGIYFVTLWKVLNGENPFI